jgi:hypothetical protein
MSGKGREAPVHASRGKFVRAEPVAVMFEQNRVHLVGSFPLLEDQLTSFVPDLDRARIGSPDRADSMVWAMTELLVEREPYAGLLEWYRREAALVAVEEGSLEPSHRAGGTVAIAPELPWAGPSLPLPGEGHASQ